MFDSLQLRCAMLVVCDSRTRQQVTTSQEISSHSIHSTSFPRNSETIPNHPKSPISEDLLPTLELLLHDDLLARSIALNAQRLAQERLTVSASYCYLAKALERLRSLTGGVGKDLENFRLMPSLRAPEGFIGLEERLFEKAGRKKRKVDLLKKLVRWMYKEVKLFLLLVEKRSENMVWLNSVFRVLVVLR